jgi:hypothetical protein
MSTLAFFGDGASTSFGLPGNAVVSAVTVAGSGVSFTRTNAGLTLASAPAAGAAVVITYSESFSQLPLAPVDATPVVINRNAVNQTGLTAAGNNKVNFTFKANDPYGWYDNVTNFRFKPTVAGWYEAHLAVQTLAGTSGETAQAQLLQNGVVTHTGPYLSTSSLAAGVAAWTSTVTGAVFLNGTTDYLEFGLYVPAGVTILQGTVQATRAHVTRLS